MVRQTSFFGFCFDADINEIIKRLDDICSGWSVSKIEKDWSIWSHVPQYGYRLTYLICTDSATDAFLSRIRDVRDYARTRNIDIDISLMDGSLEHTRLYIHSTFLDKRQRIRL